MVISAHRPLHTKSQSQKKNCLLLFLFDFVAVSIFHGIFPEIYKNTETKFRISIISPWHLQSLSAGPMNFSIPSDVQIDIEQR